MSRSVGYGVLPNTPYIFSRFSRYHALRGNAYLEALPPPDEAKPQRSAFLAVVLGTREGEDFS